MGDMNKMMYFFFWLYAIFTPKSNTDLLSEKWQKLHVQNGMQKSEFAWDRNTLTRHGLRPAAMAPRLR